MRRGDYEVVAQAFEYAANVVRLETRGGVLSGLDPKVARRVLTVAVRYMSLHFSDENYALFNQDVFLNSAGFEDEVAVLFPPESVREAGCPLAYADVKAGDWVSYTTSGGHLCTGRVKRVTDAAVTLFPGGRNWTNDYEMADGPRLRSVNWSRHHPYLSTADEIGKLRVE